jgi:hypothetical protein
MEGENSEQTLGDIYIEGISEAANQSCEFNPLAVAETMPQAL